MTVAVALDAVGWDEVDWAVEAGVDSPPQAASANERTTTTERAIQRNVERPLVLQQPLCDRIEGKKSKEEERDGSVSLTRRAAQVGRSFRRSARAFSALF
jgi:hypothetical protein